jgi:hypothetical protein
LVLSLFRLDFLCFAYIDDVEETLHLSFSLSKILLSLPVMEAYHITLSQESLDILFFASELTTKLLNYASLLEVSFSLSFNRS